jgi:hypothetical protein
MDLKFNKDVILLKQFKPYSYYLRESLLGNKVEFKCISKKYLPQVYKHYFSINKNKYDYIFFNGKKHINADKLKFQ